MGACASAPLTRRSSDLQRLPTQLPTKTLPNAKLAGISDFQAVQPDQATVRNSEHFKSITGKDTNGDSDLVSDACIAPRKDTAVGKKMETSSTMIESSAELRKMSTASSTGSTESGPSLQTTQTENEALVEDSLQQVLRLPYDIFISGPYTPGCNEARVAYSNKLHLMDSKPDAKIAHILETVSQVFNTSSVLLTLCGQERVWIRNAIGFSAGDFPWRWAFCGWSLAPPTPTVLVIEDTHEDARFRDNLVVTSGPHIRNFAGAPLVASNGHRLGTLCFLGDKPRKFTAEEMVILVNMAELVVRELEKQVATAAGALSSQPSDVAANAPAMYLNRSVHCFTNQNVLFMDTQQPLWRTLHCNETFCEEMGLSFEKIVDLPFWDLFHPPYEIGGEAWNATQEMVQGGGEFVVRGCTLRGQPGSRYTLSFRPADRAALDADSQPVGVPSDVPSVPDSGGRYYFCLPSLTPIGTQTSLSLDDPLAAVSLARAVLETPVAGLSLGTLLGKGSFGHVYRGVYKGNCVAVKVCSGALTASRGKQVKAWAGVEAVKALKLDHPCIVHTIKHTSVFLQEGHIISTHSESLFEDSPPESSHRGWDDEWFDQDDPHHPSFDSSSFGGSRGGSDSGGTVDSSGGVTTTAPTSVEMQTWAILEYCDCGTLQSGIDKGLFRMERTCKPPSEPNLHVVVAITAQLASGLSYLHRNDIIHGDLAGGNVLLLQDHSQPHGFSCKISDFGLSRDTRISSVVMTKTYGTVTHMPPELLRSGELSKAADVYAFGIILWELCHGVRAHSGLSHTQILAAVAIDLKRLRFAPGINPEIVALGRKCMSFDPEGRPTFPRIEAELERIRLQL